MSAVISSRSTPGTSTESRNAEDDVLLGPYNYICKVPGKQIRNKLARAFNYWLKIAPEQLQQVADIVQMLHNASLMIDDIEDNSILRRGLPVSHSIYGTPSTINSANYVYFLALQRCLKLGPQAMQIFTDEMLELHRGQGMEIHWRDTVTCPSEEEYLRMVRRKTGGLFNLAVKLMQEFSDNREDYTPLINNLGMYFQIRDDYANLCSKEYAEKKCFAEDLTEGKFSFPIIHAVRTNPNDSQVINILRMKPTENEVKRYCVSLLEAYGSLKYTVDKLISLEEDILSQIEHFGGNPYMIPVIEELRSLYR